MAASLEDAPCRLALRISRHEHHPLRLARQALELDEDFVAAHVGQAQVEQQRVEFPLNHACDGFTTSADRLHHVTERTEIRTHGLTKRSLVVDDEYTLY